MAQIRVTQIRSAIGTKPNQRQTLRSLGLKRIHHTVVQEDRPEIRGMVATVPHLVRVEEVSDGSADAAPTAAPATRARSGGAATK